MVGSRLMITSLAPFCLAMTGNPAAGWDLQRGADGEKQVTGQGCHLGQVHLAFRHRLAEGNRCGLDDAATGRAGRRAIDPVKFGSDPIEFMAGIALKALGVGAVAMQFDDLFRLQAGGLVQAIDILGDDVAELAQAGQFGKGAMSPARLDLADLLADLQVTVQGLAAHFRRRHEGLEVDRLVPGPDAAGRAEIGDAALGRDTGTGEADDPGCLIDQLLQTVFHLPVISG